MNTASASVLSLQASWRHCLRRGMTHLRRGSYNRANRWLEQAFAIAPEQPAVLLALGRERFRQERYREAAYLLRRVLMRQPRSVAAAAALARALEHLGYRRRALRVLDKAIRRVPDAAPLQIVRGELLMEDGRFLEARTAFEQALNAPLTDEVARIGLARTFNAEGISLSERGLHDQAIFALKRAADLDLLWSGPLVNLGVVFSRLGKRRKAVEAYQSALQREPNNPVAYFNLGALYHQLGERQRACGAFECLLRMAPDYPKVRSALANVLSELGKLDRAISLLLEELEIDHGSVGTWSSLGLAYASSGHLEASEQCLQRALSCDPTYLNAHFNLASLYVSQHRYEQAETLLRHAYDLDPQRTAEVMGARQAFQNISLTTLN